MFKNILTFNFKIFYEILRHKLTQKNDKMKINEGYKNFIIYILYMAPTIEFNNGAYLKMIVMDRHTSKGNKIISNSKYLSVKTICTRLPHSPTCTII